MMREVLPKTLWIGNASDAENVTLLLEMQISAVVDLAYEESPKHLTRDLIYCRFPLVDGANNTQSLFRAAIETVAHFIEAKVPILVCCSAGMSRSPAVVAAALSLVEQAEPNQCLERVIANEPHDVSSSLWSDIVEVLKSLSNFE